MGLPALENDVTLADAVTITGSVQYSTSVLLAEDETLYSGTAANSVLFTFDWPTGGSEDQLDVIIEVAETAGTPAAGDWHLLRSFTIVNDSTSHANTKLVWQLEGADMPAFIRRARIGFSAATPGGGAEDLTISARLVGVRNAVVSSS